MNKVSWSFKMCLNSHFFLPMLSSPSSTNIFYPFDICKNSYHFEPQVILGSGMGIFLIILSTQKWLSKAKLFWNWNTKQFVKLQSIDQILYFKTIIPVVRAKTLVGFFIYKDLNPVLMHLRKLIIYLKCNIFTVL